MDGDKIAAMVSDFVENQRYGVLATSGTKGTYASLMAYAPADGGRRIVYATERDTRKYDNMRGDEEVALLIDDRAAAGKGPEEVMTVTAIGRAQRCSSDRREEEHRRRLVERHPGLEDFLMKDECEVMVLNVREFRVVGHFQTGEEVDMILRGDEL
ncbi:MAG: pyridoxamine 5'-phosphate oxidase family protein [Planctomycetota bacterium]